MKFTIPDELNDLDLSEERIQMPISKEAKSIINETPATDDPDEFMSHAHAGDVMLSAPPPVRVEKAGVLSRIRMEIIDRAQRTPYSSAKMVADEEHVIGYGVSTKTQGQVSEVTMNYFVRQLDKSILLRHTEASQKETKEAVEWVRQRAQQKYAVDDILQGFMNKIMREKLMVWERDYQKEKLDREKLRQVFKPLICSSLIAFSYFAAGKDVAPSIKNLIDIWPADLLKSEAMKPIIRLERDHR